MGGAAIISVIVGEEVECQLEGEVELLKSQLHTDRERSMLAETSLLDSQQLFKGNLKELQDKASMLEAALERAGEAKSDVVDELAKVRGELERLSCEYRELQSTSAERERTTTKQLAEVMQSEAVKASDLKNVR